MEDDAKLTQRLMEEALVDADEKYNAYMTVHNRFILSDYEVAEVRLTDLNGLLIEE